MFSFRKEIQLQNFNICNINQVTIQTQRHFFLLPEYIRCSQRKKKKALQHCLKLERWQALQHINKAHQHEIVLFFKVSHAVMQSNRVVDGTDDCELAGQRVQQSQITSISLSEDKCHWVICVRSWCTWLLEGMGEDARFGLILCSAQNTPMTTSECKYHI